MIQLKREACLIDGAWVTGDRWFDVDDPASGRAIGRVPDLDAADAKRAVEAARAAMPAWAARSAGERAEILRRFAALIVAQEDGLAALLTQEQGKPLAEARAEIGTAAAYITWFAEEARRAYGDIIPSPRPDQHIMVIKQPVGVVAAITPWNFPAAMVARKIGPALAAGCAVVLKPSELTPFSALALGVLAQEAGLPSGLLNIITGQAANLGGELIANPAVAKVSFTGSTATGVKIFAQSAPTIKRLSLELGGNAPFIVFEDADLDAAVAGAIQSKFRNAGQTCVCANRIYVQGALYEPFIKRLAAAAAALKVGFGAEPGTEIGPLIDERAVAKVELHIRDALDRGAFAVVGGRRHPLGPRFFEPTVLRDVRQDMLVVRNETFGPVAPVVPFSTEAEVIALANDSAAGLASYLYSRDLSRIWRVAEALQTGMVGVNAGLITTEVAPFGGVKASGLGREGSKYGLDEYLALKYVCMGL